MLVAKHLQKKNYIAFTSRSNYFLSYIYFPSGTGIDLSQDWDNFIDIKAIHVIIDINFE